MEEMHVPAEGYQHAQNHSLFYLFPFEVDRVLFLCGPLVDSKRVGLPANPLLIWKLARFFRRNLKNAAELTFPN